MISLRHGTRVGGLLCALAAGPVLAQTTTPGTQPTAPATPFVAPVITDTAGLPGPRQPIFFRHDIHAGQDEIPCLYCHNTAAVSSEPGMPSLQTCMGCHLIISGTTDSHRAEIAKVRTAWSERKPPEWLRVFWLPQFARFPHQRHIKVLGEDGCTLCHGDVARMAQVAAPKESTLLMGWCIRCHVERAASRDCTVCHY